MNSLFFLLNALVGEKSLMSHYGKFLLPIICFFSFQFSSLALCFDSIVAEKASFSYGSLRQVFSFKLRGAYNMMAKIPREQLERGVICSSAGNHAQGVALSAKELKCDSIIVMPVTTPEIKVPPCLLWLSIGSRHLPAVIHFSSPLCAVAFC